MQIFSAVGPLGAGKTTLTINTIEAMIREGMTSKDRCAYIINDEGAQVDGSLIERSARVLPMTSGCFTCSDEAELRKKLDEMAQQEMEWVFLEGFGMTSGSETKKFLKSVPYPFRIVCVLDFKNHQRNLVRYSDVVKSQVHAATIGTGLTKYGRALTLMDLPDTEVLDFVARNSHGKPAFLIPEDGYLPLELLAKAVQPSGVAMSSSCSHHDHGHDHSHHHHVHAMHAYSYELRDGTTFSQVVSAFRGCPAYIWRIKGAVESKLFNSVFDDWKQTSQDNRSFVTFYSRKEIQLGTDLPGLAQLVVPDTETADDAQSYQLIRKEGASDEETIAEIQRLMQEVPDKAILLPSSDGLVRLITHPEILQILKEISRRPRIKEEWFPRAIEQCMKYWIKCAAHLKAHERQLVAADVPVNQRELAVSLAWWATHYGNCFSSDVLLRAKALRVGEMLASGALQLASLNSDAEKAYWQCQEFLCAAKFGLENGEDRDLIIKAMQHCLSLSQGTPVHGEWKKDCAQLA